MGVTIKGWGNMTLTGEFNFYADPEASRIVYENFKMIQLLPWETADEFIITEEDKIKLTTSERDDDDATKLFKDINLLNDDIDGRIYCCDGLCLAAAVNPSLVTESHSAFGRVETAGSFTAGSVFFNMCDFVLDEKVPNTNQLIAIDHDRYVAMLEDAIKN